MAILKLMLNRSSIELTPRAEGILKMNFESVSDHCLLEMTEVAVSVETNSTAQVIRHFIEIAKRDLYLARGFSSLHEMAVKHFGYDKASATRRTHAAELAMKVPGVLENLESGKLQLQAAADVQTFLNQERARKKPYSVEQMRKLVLDISGQTTRQVQMHLADLNPQISFRESKKFVSKDRLQITYTTSVEIEEKLMKIKELRSHVDPYMTRERLLDFMAESVLKAIDPSRRDQRIRKREEKRNKRRGNDRDHELDQDQKKNQDYKYVSEYVHDREQNYEFAYERDHDQTQSQDLAYERDHDREQNHKLDYNRDHDRNRSQSHDQTLASEPASLDSQFASISLRDEIVSDGGEIQLAVDFEETFDGERSMKTPTILGATESETQTKKHLKKEAKTTGETVTETAIETETETETKTTIQPKKSAAVPAQEQAMAARYIFAKDDRVVRTRNNDQGCSWVDDETGRRCGSRHQLQRDHVKEFSRGGANAAENLQILCAKHNRFRWRANPRSFVRESRKLYARA